MTNHHQKSSKILPLILFLLPILLFSTFSASAQTAGEIWTEPRSISGSGELAASDPFMISDPSGYIHLFYTQRMTREFGQPDTLMYAKWDGRNWTQPLDLFISSGLLSNDAILFPSAVIDHEGIIHLIWLGAPSWPDYSLYYSQVHSTKSGSANAWSPKKELVDDLTGTNFSVSIAYEPPSTLHVVYARVQQGDNPPEQRAVAYIRSTDYGQTWSDAVDLYTVPELDSGASNVRVIAEDSGGVFTTWSEWDATGNGQKVFFARSMDSGQTWDKPLVLDERKANEYERDWTNLTSLGDGGIIVMWEGGFRAYRHAMYSYDYGETWTDPIDTFPGLIGENGYAQFVRDGNGDLHVFLAQRIREGNPENLQGNLGLWHSVYLGNQQWKRPVLAGPPINMVNPTVAIVGGNKIAAAWYSFSDYIVRVSTGELLGVADIEPVVWPTPASDEIIAAEQSTPVISAPTPSPTPLPSELTTPPRSNLLNFTGSSVFIGVVISFLIISIILTIRVVRNY